LLFAARLAGSGFDLRLWTRSQEQAESICLEGITLTEEGSSVTIAHGSVKVSAWKEQELKLVRQTRNESDHFPDWILLTVKQKHLTDYFLESLSLLAGPDTGIVCLQNGMGHLEKLSRYSAFRHVYAAVTTEGAKKIGFNAVIRSKPGVTRVGAAAGGRADEAILVNIYRQAGFNMELSKDIGKDMYRKLLINAAINPLTAIWRIPNGELLETPARVDLLEHLIREGLEVYAAAGLAYDPDIKEQIKSVCLSTAENISSMLADVQRGEETEVEYINGYIAELAIKKGISAPAHDLVRRLVQGLRD
jgi:2-dehydropantoate 2-reductase